MDILDLVTRLTIFFVPFLFSLCFHEYAHGFVAKLRGDNTAQMMGRLTLNPLSHIDPIGTIILPVLSVLFHSPISFGWAKPVPVNSRNLKNPRTDMFWVALAGPLSNIFLAFVGCLSMVLTVLFLKQFHYFQGILTLLKAFIGVNLFLAVFNLIPLNPLDGGKVLARFLPASVNYKLEQNEHITSMLLLLLLLSGAAEFLSFPVNWLYQIMIQASMGLLT